MVKQQNFNTKKKRKGKEAADFIKKIKKHLPGCVQQVLLRTDGEFLSWPSIIKSEQNL